mgnify:CR=1 FL=1
MRNIDKKKILKGCVSEFVSCTGAQEIDLNDELIDEQIKNLDKSDIDEIKDAMNKVSQFYMGIY